MIYQTIDFNMESFMTPILDIGVLLVLMLIMVYCYAKFRYFPLITLVMLMSLVIGVVSIQLQYNPFTPWFQAFFILFNVLFFFKTAMDYKALKNRG